MAMPTATINPNIYISGTTASTSSWQPLGTVQSITFDETSAWKKPQKYWWKYTHFECPLCGDVETVRERIDIYEQPKPEDPADRHIDVTLTCGFHFT
jgi:hypothetical protein